MPPPEQLTHREVHFWLAFPEQVRQQNLTAACLDLLSPDERVRHAGLRCSEHRHEFLTAHALLRDCLSRYTRVDPRAWAFSANACGRPEIAAPKGIPPIRFSLAHTGGLVACAVTMEHDIGIDVENTRHPEKVLEVARRYFAPAENLALQSLPPGFRRERFFDFWTLKEAYVKARGMGLSLPLQHFAFRLGEEESISISFSPPIHDDPAAWRFFLFRPTAHHRASLAVCTGAEPVSVLRIRQTVPLLGGKARATFS